jgi:diguanylate cyclase (GGDEF)-like protein/PAS domain S-box-containing protein
MPSRFLTLRLATTLLPLTLCFGLVAGLLPVGDRIDWPPTAAALGLQIVVGVLLGLRRRMPRHEGHIAVTMIVVYLGSVALLRHAAGGGAGYEPLVLLAVGWPAVRGRRVQVAVALAGIAALFYAPLLLIGAPEYPTSDWRAGTLTLAVAASVGFAIVALFGRLRAHSKRSKTILAAMSEGYALTRDGEIVAVNPALSAITGFTERELRGARPPYPFWPPEASDTSAELRHRLVDTGGGEIELMLMHADGRRFPASVTVTPTDLGDGRTAFVNTVRDITERRRHEEAQRRHSEHLAAIAEVTRLVNRSDPLDARRTICQIALSICAGADSVAIWEPGRGGALQATATEPDRHALRTIAADDHDHGAQRALATTESCFVTAGRSAHYEPIVGAGGAVGVLGILWPAALTELPPDVEPLLSVLSAEAALALDRADLLARLDELTRTDELTGLPNRRAWDELLTHELAGAARRGHPVSVAMLDLDFFKRYNDLHGHLAGDRLLREAAATWQEQLRLTDTLARWGGEEFALLLPASDAAAAGRVVEQLRGTLPGDATFSAGIAAWDGHSTPGELIDAADRALYAAKTGGRDRVVVL